MRQALALGLALALLMPAGAGALTLQLPAPATATASVDKPLVRRELAAGPWQGGKMPRLTAEGPLHEVAWRIEKRGLSSLKLINDLRAQLKVLGYTTLFQCSTDDCGGFDFRYALGTLPEPQMHVDLGDFRYLLAEKRPAEKGAGQGAPAGTAYVTLLVSSSAAASFVQVVQVGGESAPLAAAAGKGDAAAPALSAIAPAVGQAMPADAKALAAALEANGSVALDDLNFATGAAELSEGNYESLKVLAAYLLADPKRQVALVGHTDAVGALDANIALSKRRAESVRQRLIEKYGVAAGQVTAEGVGYLAPRASNQTREGRTENRRVEVMLTSTQ